VKTISVDQGKANAIFYVDVSAEQQKSLTLGRARLERWTQRDHRHRV